LTQRKSVTLQAVNNVAQYLSVARLDSIKSRILALAVLGTLLPAVVILSIAYTQSRRALERRITQALVAETNQTSGAVNVWVKERLYDLRVFATSQEVASNLSRPSAAASPRLYEYLRSLHERFTDFEQLLVVDANGRVLATNEGKAHPVHLTGDWQKTMRQEGHIVGDAYWEDGKGKMVMAVPVQRPDGHLMGAFAAEINLAPVRMQLKSFLSDTVSGAVYLVGDSGKVLASSREISERLFRIQMSRRVLSALGRGDSSAVTYTNFQGREVLGAIKKVPQMHWSVVAEASTDVALAQVKRFRNVALLVMVGLLVLITAAAYRFGLIIVRPLERLASGAAEVAMGDLDVDLPAAANSSGEVGALTKIFNEMVSRLRAGRLELANANETLRQKNRELELLSVTDGLTGLTNHRALMQRLNEEGVRSRRNERAFSVIMADVDHFKQYNDQFGHPEGDQVLKAMASILKDSTRTVDCVARYGGEEFAVVLPETDITGALEVAERIRSRVERTEFPKRKITLSIGVAEFPRDATTPGEIVVVADEALYVAKRQGRNQVVQANSSRASAQKLPMDPAASRKTAKKKG
jgi:diguanylate cyclase (GGDEF)-like protein